MGNTDTLAKADSPRKNGTWGGLQVVLGGLRRQDEMTKIWGPPYGLVFKMVPRTLGASWIFLKHTVPSCNLGLCY